MHLPEKLERAPGTVLDVTMFDAECRFTVDSLQADGFFGASVTWAPVEVNRDQVDVVIAVERGARTIVNGFLLAGNAKVRTVDLLAIVSKLNLVGTPWTTDSVRRASEALASHYWDQGYLLARVAGPHPPTQAAASPDFQIDEGDIYRFGTIEIVGGSSAMKLRARAILGARSGDVIDYRELARSTRSLELSLGREVTVTWTADKTHGTVALQVDLEP